MLQRRATKRAVAVGLGLVVLALLAVLVDVERLAATLADASPILVLAAGASYALFFVLRGARWRLLLAHAAPGASAGRLAGISAVGWLVNSYVPLRAGEAVRAALASRTGRCALPVAAGSIVAERALDVLGLALAATVALAVLALAGGPAVPPLASQAVLLAWALPLALLAGLIVASRILARGEGEGFVRRTLAGLVSTADLLRRSPRVAAPLVLLTVLLTAAQVTVVACLVRAVVPDASLAAVLLGAPLFLLSFVVTVTPGNVGTYEAAFVVLFALVGLDPDGLWEQALAVHILSTALATGLGLAGLVFVGDLRPWRARTQGEQVVAK